MASSETPVTAAPAPTEPVVKLILRPICDGWNMGEDWEVILPLTLTFYNLKAFIETERGINRHRIMLRLKGKALAPSKEKFTFRRIGLYDGYVIQVEPTMSGSWWWHPYGHYEEKFLAQIEAHLNACPEKGAFLSDLIPVFIPPPPINKGLRILLRIHPERFHIYCDIKNNTFWVRRSKTILELPVFDSVSHTVGHFQHFQAEPFDWDNYMDVDDKCKVETFETAVVVEEIVEGKEEVTDEAAYISASASAKESSGSSNHDSRKSNSAIKTPISAEAVLNDAGLHGIQTESGGQDEKKDSTI